MPQTSTCYVQEQGSNKKGDFSTILLFSRNSPNFALYLGGLPLKFSFEENNSCLLFANCHLKVETWYFQMRKEAVRKVMH